MLKIKQIRIDKKYNQSEFSKIIGISPRALSSYENGNLDITLKKLKEISEILQVDFYDLFNIPKKYLEKEKDFPTSLQVNESKENYNINNFTIEKAQEKTINILEREVEDLRSDKDLLKNIITSKILK